MVSIFLPNLDFEKVDPIRVFKQLVVHVVPKACHSPPICEHKANMQRVSLQHVPKVVGGGSLLCP